MTLQFQKKEIPCLRNVLSQVQNLEQTQELRLPEGMPGAAQILGTWGQVLIRSKEWRRDSLSVSGGILIWVLYEPEDGSPARCLDSWISFQTSWDLPEDCPEGKIRILPRLRYADARTVSAGKILVRCGVGLLAELWCGHVAETWLPEQEQPEGLEILRSRWPVRLPVESGEKAFDLEETLNVPAGAPVPDRILHFSMEPAVTDRKILGSRLVFRGSGNFHLVYFCREGQVHTWDFELPFSQFTDLAAEYSPEARADVMMAVTRLDLETDASGNLHLKAGLTGQYLVDERKILETVEDAYSPHRDVEIRSRQPQIPALLDSRRETVPGECTVNVQTMTVADVSFRPDFPRQHRQGDSLILEQSAAVQVLYYGDRGELRSASHRWEGKLVFPADPGAAVTAVPLPAKVQTAVTGEGISLRGEVPLGLMTLCAQQIPMVTEVRAGELRQPDPDRPALILCRPGEKRLWDLARAGGSTVEAIRKANGLTGEPEPGKLLLIPVV